MHSKASVALFLIGFPILVLYAFFSPSLASEGKVGMAVLLLGVITLLFLVKNALYGKKWLRVLVVIQLALLALLLYQTLSDGRLYIGT